MAINASANVWCCSQCGAIYHKDFPRCPNDGAEIVKSDRDPLVGHRIDHYIIDSLIGEGGMGRVYRAHHVTLSNRHYAIKVLLGDVAATASMRKRFVQEAEIASKLEHPNLVSVEDFGQTPSGLPYIVMEFVDGEVLTDILDDAPMDPARVVRIARSVCEGVAYLHEAGLIHRDLKPDNIIVVKSANGEVPRLTDFGLALVADAQQERLTSTGMAMGTPAYAAPEQMGGKKLDARVDLYALGMTMYEMLTGGELPWEGSPMEIATAKAHKDAPLIRSRKPNLVIPDGLEQLLASLLRRRPDERPPNARAVISLLAALEQREERAVVRAPRSRALFAAVAGAAVLGAGGWFAFGRSSGASGDEARATDLGLRRSGSGSGSEEQLARIEPEAKAVDDPAPVAEMQPQPDEPVAAKPSRRHHHDHKSHKVSTADRSNEPSPSPSPSPSPGRQPPPPTATVTATATATASVAAPLPLPQPPPPPPPPPPAPLILEARLSGLDIQGPLPRADVERAVRRVMPAVAKCLPSSPETIVAQLEIGESRRARDVHASGGTSSSCVASALSAVRTEAAPDVGDVSVIIHIRFTSR